MLALRENVNHWKTGLKSLVRIEFQYRSKSNINYNINKQSKVLKKLMLGSAKKKWYDGPSLSMMIPKNETSTVYKCRPPSSNPRRMLVFNSILLEHVSDIMSSGEVSPEILGLGIEITRVQVSSDFSRVLIYWLSTKSKDEFEIGHILESNAGKIRSQLCSLNILGNVPYVCFVKDRYQEKIDDVERLLAKADFGPDFEPCDPTHDFKSAIILKRQIPNFPALESMEPINNEVSQSSGSMLVDDRLKDGDVTGATVMPNQSNVNSGMRMDIMGLNHADMMKQVLHNMHRAKALHRQNSVDIDMDVSENDEIFAAKDRDPEGVMDFQQYLQQQKRLKRLTRKQGVIDKKTTEFLSDYEKTGNADSACEMEDFEEEDYYNDEEMHVNHTGDNTGPVQ